MQSQITTQTNFSSQVLPKTETGLIKSTIVLAPDLVEMPRLIKNARMLYASTFRKVKEPRLKDLSLKGLKAQEDSEKICKYFDEIVKKMRWILSHNVEPFFETEGDRQACMWLLCTIYCDNMMLPNRKNVFYSGVGFGEFWALTYRMYQLEQISFREAIWLAKRRGDRMSLIMEPYYTVSVREKKKEYLYALLPKKSKIGILSTTRHYYHLYGTQEELRRVAEYYKAEVKESIPFFSSYLLNFVRPYAERFPMADQEPDTQLILSRQTEDIEELIVKQVCNRFDEDMLRTEISFYEPNEIREI